MATTKLRILNGDSIEFFNASGTSNSQVKLGLIAGSYFGLTTFQNSACYLTIYNKKASTNAGFAIADGTGTVQWLLYNNTSNYFNIANSSGTSAVTIDGSLLTVGINNTGPQAMLDVGGMVRVVSTNTPASGAGIELDYNSSIGYLTAYDRGGSAWKDLIVRGLSVTLQSSGTSVVYVNNGKMGIGVDPSYALDVVGGIHTTTANYLDGTVRIGVTKHVLISPEYAGSGEIPSGTYFGSNGSYSLSLLPASDNGSTSSKIAICYYNQSAWYSALEISNVSSGYGSLLLMKSGGNVGIGKTSPSSAYLHITNGTTSLAPLRFTSTSGALLSSVTADAIEYDGNSLFYTLNTTLRHSFSGVIYSTDTSAGPAGTTTETSVLASNPSTTWESLTIPANYLVNCKTIRLKAWGYYTTQSSGLTTFTLKFYFGSNKYIATTGTITPGNSYTNQYWECELSLSTRNSGATAYFQHNQGSTLWYIGKFTYFTSASTPNSVLFSVDGTAGTPKDNFDATASNTIDLKCTIGGGYTDGVFKCVNATIELLA